MNAVNRKSCGYTPKRSGCLFTTGKNNQVMANKACIHKSIWINYAIDFTAWNCPCHTLSIPKRKIDAALKE